jgi:hypothetical protein
MVNRAGNGDMEPMSTQDPTAWHPTLGGFVDYQGECYQVVYSHQVGFRAPAYSLHHRDGHWRHWIPDDQLHPALPPATSCRQGHWGEAAN